MILYHGSNIAIDVIDLGKSKPNKDFGKAFYLSEQKQQAEEKDFDFMVDILTRDLITLLMERQDMDMKSAFDIFYNSDTYATLNRPESGLYFQSPKYVYSILENEIKTGKMG